MNTLAEVVLWIFAIIGFCTSAFIINAYIEYRRIIKQARIVQKRIDERLG